MPKFNLNWLYMIIAMMLLGLYLTNESGTATKNISYDEFQQYVRDGYISKVIGYDDNSVEAYVKPQHVGNVFRQDSSRVGKNPLITTEAPSRESLGNFLQKERDDAHFDGSINYEKKRNYFGAILWQILPFAFLIGFWIFMSRRMSGGGGMGGGGGIFSVGKSKAQLFEKGSPIKITFKDVAGLAEAKQEVEEIVEFLKEPQKYTDLGGKIPKGALLVGPPGTGKTSIARSIARALDKKYVRISLGGVRDEAEIRGHRRTYVGAMPGRIVNGLRMAGVKNPLMLLDEIDKMSSDYKGDTASAMLEVLDSEQNHKFRDHYVELPVDLSEVLFIASANSMQDIPGPLLDRMEIIEVSSYTENEKFHIAKDHLLAKQFEKNGVADGKLKITDKALRMVISSYTREAGVRSLERQIGEICRKAARRIYEGDEKMIRVTGTNLEDFLGKLKYRPEKKNKKNEVGIVRGLAWTSVGGVTLEIEVNLMPGKGSVVLTGKLGDVMKESAQTGISYIRSISEDYHIDPEFFQKHDIHIHVPEGAVPKDGPSAGITMATAILSAVTGKPVRADVAMTGEITLRGRVLPIGGLKEKLLAAKNAGMKTVCIPKENEQDLAEISEEIVGDMEIIPVEHMDQVIKAAFV